MNKKFATDTTLVDFRRRFPTTDDLVTYLLATPPNRKVTVEQLYHEMNSKEDSSMGENMIEDVQ